MTLVQRTKEKVKGYAREDAVHYVINLMERNIDTYLLFVDEILNLEEISDEDTEWKIVLFESWFEYSERKKERNKKH